MVSVIGPVLSRYREAVQ